MANQNNAFASPASDAAQGSSQVNKVKPEIQKYDTAKKKLTCRAPTGSKSSAISSGLNR